jgi:hypothetical protein
MRRVRVTHIVWVLAAIAVIAYLWALASRPVPSFTSEPVGSVAPEVCEHDGAVRSVQREDGTPWLFVTCASGRTPVVHR